MPTGIRLRISDTADTSVQRSIKETTHFLNLIIPIPIKRESNEKTIAKST